MSSVVFLMYLLFSSRALVTYPRYSSVVAVRHDGNPLDALLPVSPTSQSSRPPQHARCPPVPFSQASIDVIRTRHMGDEAILDENESEVSYVSIALMPITLPTRPSMLIYLCTFLYVLS
jgi:hypothetical protein